MVDSASIAVSRRKRRAKADRLDAEQLLRQLIRHHDGERGCWSVVRVRSMMVEIARLWLRCQPDSQLSQWYQARFADNGKRMRRVGIIASARRLLIALWRYLEDGVFPDGVRLIPATL